MIMTPPAQNDSSLHSCDCFGWAGVCRAGYGSPPRSSVCIQYWSDESMSPVDASNQGRFLHLGSVASPVGVVPVRGRSPQATMYDLVGQNATDDPVAKVAEVAACELGSELRPGSAVPRGSSCFECNRGYYDHDRDGVSACRPCAAGVRCSKQQRAISTRKVWDLLRFSCSYDGKPSAGFCRPRLATGIADLRRGLHVHGW
jgi:hypothetical protein